MGVLDSIIKHSYPIPSPSQKFAAAEMKVLGIAIHNVIFHLAVHTYTWGGELHYSYQIPVTADNMNRNEREGEDARRGREEREILRRYVEEVERVMRLVAGGAHVIGPKL